MTAADAAAIATASHLFDHAVRAEWALHFLAQPNHHLCIAYSDGEPVGFISGAELTHPDKGTEMFLYELFVDDRFPAARYWEGARRSPDRDGTQ